MLTMYAGKYLSASLSFFVFLVLFSEGVASQSTVTVSVSSSLPTGHANIVQDNFLGISWELSSFDTLCESHPPIPFFTPRSLVSSMFLPVSPHAGVYSPRRHSLLFSRIMHTDLASPKISRFVRSPSQGERQTPPSQTRCKTISPTSEPGSVNPSVSASVATPWTLPRTIQTKPIPC